MAFVLSICLKQNNSREQATFLNVGGNFLIFEQLYVWTTFGYIVKQLFLNLLAQFIHAYRWPHWWQKFAVEGHSVQHALQNMWSFEIHIANGALFKISEND